MSELRGSFVQLVWDPCSLSTRPATRTCGLVQERGEGAVAAGSRCIGGLAPLLQGNGEAATAEVHAVRPSHVPAGGQGPLSLLWAEEAAARLHWRGECALHARTPSMQTPEHCCMSNGQRESSACVHVSAASKPLASAIPTPRLLLRAPSLTSAIVPDTRWHSRATRTAAGGRPRLRRAPCRIWPTWPRV
jgi:hypothetical protein